MMDEKRCYEILGVSKQVSDEELRKQYRILLKKYHPDLNVGNQNAERISAEINVAYDTLIAIRADRVNKFSLKNIFTGRAAESPDEPVQTVEPERGLDIKTDIKISYMESLTGCKKKLDISRYRRCRCCYDGGPEFGCLHCKGSGRIRKNTVLELTIPRYVEDKQVLKITGKGNVGDIGAADGDIIITVHITPDERYVLKGNDVYFKLNVTFPEAVMGTKKKINTAQGIIECSIPAGVKSETKVRLRGKGIADKETGKIGDQYVIIKIDIPKAETVEEVEILNKIQQIFYGCEL